MFLQSCIDPSSFDKSDFFFNRAKLGSKRAFCLLKKLSRKGREQATYHVAQCYLRGWGVDSNLEMAAKKFQFLASIGHPQGAYQLGCSYLFGIGSEVDQDLAAIWFYRAVECGEFQALELLRSLALSGNREAEYYYGRYFQEGFGEPENQEKATLWFLRAARKGCPEAIEEIAEYYLKKPDMAKEAFYWAKQLAEIGDPFNREFVGFCLFEGIGVQKDRKKGLKFFEGAAEAYKFSGHAYELGWGVKKDFCIATSRYLVALKRGKRAAVIGLKRLSSKGSAAAKFALAQCYFHGLGVECSAYLGVKKLIEAAGLGLPEAQLMLGKFYSKGELFEKDLREAVFWFRKAEKGGSIEARYYLGLCYMYGMGVKKDQEKGQACFPDLATLEYFFGCCLFKGKIFLENTESAMDLFKKAAELGLQKAQFKYGVFLLQKDQKKAFYWLSLAAGAGHAEAQYYLGSCYLFGYGTKKDEVKAAECFKESADQGYFHAKYFLGLCYQNGWGVERDEAQATTLAKTFV